MKCNSCSESAPPEAKFCMACGSPLGEPANSLSPATAMENLRRLAPRQYVDRLLSDGTGTAAERRVVTILFADVVDSTAMAETLDPEDVMEIMNGAFAVLIEPIVRYEGTVARLMGDGVLSFFGAPVAHEEDPERACNTALEILKNAREYGELMSARHGISGFDVRVGINTGLVVVGEVGGVARVEYTAMGDAVNLAARIQSAADPGTALITGKTYGHVRGAFDVEDRGAIKVRGKTEPVHTYRLVGKKKSSSYAAATGSAPLVGRSHELQAVLDAVENLSAGRGGRITITGDPGIGKTRLLAEARGICGARVNWVTTRCTSYSVDMAYQVIRDMTSDLFGLDPGISNDAAVLHVAGELSLLPRRHADDDRLTAMSVLLKLPLAENESATAQRSNPQHLRSQILNTVCDVVRFRAQDLPLVFVFDDLQWADDTSIDSLEELMAATEDAAVLYIMVHRSADARAVQLCSRLNTDNSSSQSQIVLAPLETSAAERMLNDLVDNLEVSERFRGIILGCAEGNPFILEEVARSLSELGGTDPENRATLDGSQLSGANLSTRIRGVITARLDCLTPSQHQLLQSASAIGRYFGKDVLAEAGDRGESLETSLNELEQREFIHPVGKDPRDDGAVPNSASQTAPLAEGTHAFRHPMTSEVLYESMLNPQRQAIHLRVAHAMERLYSDRAREMSPILAYHYEQADVADKAFDYLVLAATSSAEVCANPEAIRLYRRALALAESKGLRRGRSSDVASTHERLGDVYFTVGDYAAAMEQYLAAKNLVQTPSQLATIHRKEGQTCLRWGKYDSAQKHYEAALERLRECPDDAAGAHICAGLGLVYWHQGQFDAAIQMEKLALATLESVQDDQGIATVCNSLGVMYARDKEWDIAQTSHERALAICRERALVYDIAAVLNNMGLVAHRRGDARKAVGYFEESLEQFKRVGNKHGLACALDNTSQAYFDLGETDRAADYLQRAVTILKEIGTDQSEIVPEMWKSGEW